MGRAAPDWPALMKRDLARLYVDMTTAEFERAIAKGALPQPIDVAGAERWSRSALDTSLDVLAGDTRGDWRKRVKLFGEQAA